MTSKELRDLARRVLCSMSGTSAADAIDEKTLEEEFKRDHRTVTKALGRMGGFQTWKINPFLTDYNHQFLVDVKLNNRVMSKWWSERERLGQNNAGDTPVETFIETTIEEMGRYGGHIVVRNVFIVYGTDRDACFLIYTDDGMQSLGRYLCTEWVSSGLAESKCHPIGWNRCYGGWSGEKLCSTGAPSADNSQKNMRSQSARS